MKTLFVGFLFICVVFASTSQPNRQQSTIAGIRQSTAASPPQTTAASQPNTGSARLQTTAASQPNTGTPSRPQTTAGSRSGTNGANPSRTSGTGRPQRPQTTGGASSRPKGCDNRDTMKFCFGDAKPTMCKEETPTCSDKTVLGKTISCPSCLPKAAVGDVVVKCKTIKETPDCAAGVEPTVERSKAGLCPSCKPAFEKDQCTRDKMDRCKRDLTNKTACTERSIFDKAKCCLNCKPLECTRTCPTQARDLRACAEAETGKLTDTCCRSCIPKAVKDKKKADSDDKKWTREEFKDALRETPECNLGEKAAKDSRLPVPTCKRPQSKHSVRDVVDCMKDRSECGSFQEFRDILPGQACPACKPPKPVCAGGCNATKICVPFARGGRVNITRGTKCVGKRKFKLRLKARKRMNALREKMKTMDKEGFVELLREVVARFCERTDDEVKNICDNRLELIIASLKCEIVKRKTDGDDSEVEVQIEVSDERSGEVAAGRRRLLEEDDTETFIKDALNDSEEVETAEESSTGETVGSPSTKLVAGVGSTIFVSLIGWMLA